MRRSVLGLIMLIALCLTAVAPAQAATKPPQVGLVSFSAATLHSLTITWAPVARATKYEIFMSRSYTGLSKSKNRIASTKTPAAWIGKLDSNANYFFQVRALNGKTAGSRSARVGHSTLRATGAAAGPVYRVMTYNICSRVCSGWDSRRPAVMERVQTLQPDVVALQESQDGDDYGIETGMTSLGYSPTTYKSAKMLYFNPLRFDLAKKCVDAAAAKVAPPTTATPPPTTSPATPTPTPTTETSPATPTPTPTPTPTTETSPATPTPTTEAPSSAPTTEVPASEPAPAAAAATTTAPVAKAACVEKSRTGWILLSDDGDDQHGTEDTGIGSKYAVWAELIDKTANNKHVIFVSTHLVTGSDTKAANWRRDEIWQLLNSSKLDHEGLRAINPGDALPVIIAGDFNSYKGKANDTVGYDLNRAAYFDSFDQALNLTNQHFNSFGGFRVAPPFGIIWGDHLDHVWVNPWITRTLYWENVGRRSGSNYATPIGSDHNPIMVTVQVN